MYNNHQQYSNQDINNINDMLNNLAINTSTSKNETQNNRFNDLIYDNTRYVNPNLQLSRPAISSMTTQQQFSEKRSERDIKYDKYNNLQFELIKPKSTSNELFTNRPLHKFNIDAVQPTTYIETTKNDNRSSIQERLNNYSPLSNSVIPPIQHSVANQNIQIPQPTHSSRNFKDTVNQRLNNYTPLAKPSITHPTSYSIQQQQQPSPQQKHNFIDVNPHIKNNDMNYLNITLPQNSNHHIPKY